MLYEVITLAELYPADLIGRRRNARVGFPLVGNHHDLSARPACGINKQLRELPASGNDANRLKWLRLNVTHVVITSYSIHYTKLYELQPIILERALGTELARLGLILCLPLEWPVQLLPVCLEAEGKRLTQWAESPVQFQFFLATDHQVKPQIAKIALGLQLELPLLEPAFQPVV